VRTILIGLYIACELIANVTACKPVELGGIVVPAAIFIYTLTFTPHPVKPCCSEQGCKGASKYYLEENPVFQHGVRGLL
jgi:hypothetical protein